MSKGIPVSWYYCVYDEGKVICCHADLVLLYCRYRVPNEYITLLTQSSVRGGLDLPNNYFERHRLLSFSNWPKEDIVTGRSLAAVGFQHTGKPWLCLTIKLKKPVVTSAITELPQA